MTEVCVDSAIDEPLAGTAPVAHTWLVLESGGPWGARPLESEPFTELAELSGGGITVLLARRPSARTHGSTYWLADTRPGHEVLWQGTWSEDSLHDIIAAAEHPQDPPPAATQVFEPVFFVCTNGRRDACCARLGRPVAATVPDAWECTHLGGHRFAATALALPTGYVFGRLDPTSAQQVWADLRSGQVDLAHLRGRTCYNAHMQAVEIFVRQQTGTSDIAAIAVDAGDVSHIDGRQWRPEVEEIPLDHPRRESCGKAEVAGVSYRVSV